MQEPLTFPPKEELIITAHDTMPEAGRKALLKFLAEMSFYEEMARLGEDIEGVHKMRVATRRLRSAYRVFKPYLSNSYGKYLQPLRRTAWTLGTVRDLDVFILATQKHIETQLNNDPIPLQPLLEQLNEEHIIARATLITWLDGKKFQQFKHGFFDHLMQPSSVKHLKAKKGSIEPNALQVRHLLPVLIYGAYHNVRRYDTVIETAEAPALHQLRIHAKRLRYTLDAFEDVLGVNGKRVIATLKDFQDHLGDLNDASVGIERLRQSLKQIPPDQQEGVLVYHAVFEANLQAAINAMPRAWRKFNSYQMRQQLGLAVARL